MTVFIKSFIAFAAELLLYVIRDVANKRKNKGWEEDRRGTGWRHPDVKNTGNRNSQEPPTSGEASEVDTTKGVEKEG